MLQPTVTYKPEMGKIVSKEIEQFLFSLIYKPLLAVVKEQTNVKIKLNVAESPESRLIAKIQKGDILYDGKTFTGRFDSQSSKAIKAMGGVWDTLSKSFALSPTKLTPSVKSAVSSSRARLKETHDGIKRELDKSEAMADQAIDDMDISDGIEKIVELLQDQTITAMDSIGVGYTLTWDQRKKIKEDYTNNMKLYIKTWSHEHIKTLRADVEENAMEGYRFDRLTAMLEHRYGTTKSKAEFLAQQETSLFMAKFRQQRFLDAGVNFYRWDTVDDGKVRKTHEELDGRIFQFGDPPVTSPSGERNEPGEDYRCRCIARPITDKVTRIGKDWQIVK